MLSARHHADAGLDNQLAFLDSALDWVAEHTPRDAETRYLEAAVTTWHNTDDPEVVVLRSDDRRRRPDERSTSCSAGASACGRWRCCGC